jgi:hypothetical protein
MSLVPDQAQLLPEQPRTVPAPPGARLVKRFLFFTIGVTVAGLLISIGSGVFVGLGWKSLRSDGGSDGKIDGILTMTRVSHTVFWATVCAGIAFYLLTLLVFWRVSTADQRARNKKRAFKASALKTN